MALFNEVTPFPRRNRTSGNTHTPKARPIMKLEWNKLLAEATEKDTKNENHQYEYDVDEDEEEEDDTNREDENMSSSRAEEGDVPLNLCYKSNTMPSLSSEIQKSLVLDLSSEKNKHVANNCTPWQSKKSSCTVPNFQTFNSNYKTPSSHQVSFDSNQNKNDKDQNKKNEGEIQSIVSNVRRNLDYEINKVPVDYEINKVPVDDECKKSEKPPESSGIEQKLIENHVNGESHLIEG